MSAYLTRPELQELSGYSQRSAVIGWLDRNGWPYVNAGVDGWPRVLRLFHDQKLLGVSVAPVSRKRAEPNWTRS